MLYGCVFDLQRLRKYGYWRFRNDLCTTDWPREQMFTLYSSFDAISVPKWRRSTWTLNLARVHVERATLPRTARVFAKCFIRVFAVSSYSIYFAAHSAGKLISVLGTWNSQNTWEDLLTGSAGTLADDDLYSAKCLQSLVGEPEGKRLLGKPRRRWVDNIKWILRK
jgi:hypothetical protein